MEKIGNDSGSLRKKVFDTLENAILNGEYNAGDSLSELSLSKTLGVSRTPVREALMQLELEGLVKNIPNKNAIVIGISIKDIEDIYAIRVRIEGLASSLATENITEEELNALEKTVDLQEFYLQKNDNDQIWKLDGDFHKIIYDSSRNRPLKSMLTDFHKYIMRARDISVNVEGRAKFSVAEHRSILEAIRNGNKEMAESLTAKHIENAKDNLIKEFNLINNNTLLEN